MKTSVLATFGVVAIGVAAFAALRGSPGRSVDTEDIDLSACVTDASIQVTANPDSISLGQSSVVSWAVAPRAGCSSMRVSLNGSPVALSGNRTVSPPAQTFYTIAVRLTQGGTLHQKTASTRIKVGYPPRVVIDANTPDPAGLLLGVLASPNQPQLIELCDVDIELTGRRNIQVTDNISLIASPACERGPRRFGPRIFVSDTRSNSPLFVVRGDNVLIRGFRLEGPSGGELRGDSWDKAILISPFSRAEPVRNVEVSNMEIYNWPGIGVQVEDETEQAERGRLFNTNESALRIVDNYFHHDRNVQLGYGVEVAGGAYALFARNVFDQNRHAIAGGSVNANGRDYSGYTARDNLILTGGGYACATWIIEKCWQTHQIDMHGDQNAWYGDENWQCGVAGETMIIKRNTILYTKGSSIKIRGNPADKVVVDNNVFKLDSTDEVIEQKSPWGCDDISRPVEVRPNNLFSQNPIAALGKCDFVGDGHLDEFMATGVTWWARSIVTGQWRHLNTMPQVLSLLSLERVDGDAVCDVTLKRPPGEVPRTYSKNGTGPWIPYPE